MEVLTFAFTNKHVNAGSFITGLRLNGGEKDDEGVTRIQERIV